MRLALALCTASLFGFTSYAQASGFAQKNVEACIAYTLPLTLHHDQRISDLARERLSQADKALAVIKGGAHHPETDFAKSTRAFFQVVYNASDFDYVQNSDKVARDCADSVAAGGTPRSATNLAHAYYLRQSEENKAAEEQARIAHQQRVEKAKTAQTAGQKRLADEPEATKFLILNLSACSGFLNVATGNNAHNRMVVSEIFLKTDKLLKKIVFHFGAQSMSEDAMLASFEAYSRQLAISRINFPVTTSQTLIKCAEMASIASDFIEKQGI